MSFVVRDVASPKFPTVLADDSVLQAVRKLLRSHIAAIPVVDPNTAFIGVVTQVDALRLVAQGRDLEAVPVADVAQPCSVLAPDQVIEGRQQAMVDGLPLAPVVEHGKLTAVVTPVDVDARRQIAELLGDRASQLVTTVSPDDDMYFNSLGSYLNAGGDALIRIREAMRRVGKSDARAMLDMACGHGRVLRFLKAAFPTAELTACDIKADAVDFCAATFGANPVYSEEDFSEVQIDQDFDLIWVGSLFTHLDRARWLDLLALLADRLGANGLLVFTTIGLLGGRGLRDLGMWDDQIERIIHDCGIEGFSYQESKGMPGWGLTVCSKEFVRDSIERRTPLQMVSHVSQGWLRQDVVACTNPSN